MCVCIYIYIIMYPCECVCPCVYIIMYSCECVCASMCERVCVYLCVRASTSVHVHIWTGRQTAFSNDQYPTWLASIHQTNWQMKFFLIILWYNNGRLIKNINKLILSSQLCQQFSKINRGYHFNLYTTQCPQFWARLTFRWTLLGQQANKYSCRHKCMPCLSPCSGDEP